MCIAGACDGAEIDYVQPPSATVLQMERTQQGPRASMQIGASRCAQHLHVEAVEASAGLI